MAVSSSIRWLSSPFRILGFPDPDFPILSNSPSGDRMMDEFWIVVVVGWLVLVIGGAIAEVYSSPRQHDESFLNISKFQTFHQHFKHFSNISGISLRSQIFQNTKSQIFQNTKSQTFQNPKSQTTTDKMYEFHLNALTPPTNPCTKCPDSRHKIETFHVVTRQATPCNTAHTTSSPLAPLLLLRLFALLLFPLWKVVVSPAAIPAMKINK